jgi:hypothetical protein
MVPVWADGLNLRVESDGIYRYDRAAGHKLLLQNLTCEQWAVADQFGCGRNLWAIAQELARVERGDPTATFVKVRCLFLRWCQQGWCHPAQVHEWDGIPPSIAAEAKSPVMKETRNHPK